MLPPPVASKDFDQGQNATALTAAECFKTYFNTGVVELDISHKVQQLSFPPTATTVSSLFIESPG